MRFFAGYLLLLIISVNTVSAQHHPPTIKVENGTWSFSYFKYGIVKSTFNGKGQTHQEQVSNAVVVTPEKNMKLSDNSTEVAFQDGNIYYSSVNTSLPLLNYFENGLNKGFRFQLDAGERIFGTGEKSVPLNRRGYKLNLNNNPWYGYGVNADNLNYSVPFIISSKGYGIFFDNPSRGYLDIGKTSPDILEYGATSGELTFYIIPGKNPDEILRKYQWLVGTQPIPARWVFGNLMSRFGYRSDEQLTSIINKMKEEKFPVDAVILDLFWFGDSIKHTLGNLDWMNKKAWPDPKGMISRFKKEGINTILITEPFVLNTTPNYDPSKKFHAVDSSGKPFVLTDFYFGNGGLIDIFRKDAQDWFWDKYKKQISNGVAGWWGDLGEPERHPSGINHNLKDLGFNRLFKADEVHNIYGHYWDKMLFDKYAKEYPTVRLFNLNRSGYAGSPRYCVFPWSGDVSRSWDGLKAQLPLMIGMSLSGVPYIHADAGGFAGGTGDAELYTRWMQFAVFTPVFRPHGTALGTLDPNAKDIPSEAALYDDPYKSIVRKYMRIRYALLPYNYTLAYEQSSHGKPLVRPLFYYESSDTNLYNAGDEFMWGDAILVAPVLEKDATSRKLYLPEGKWYEYIKDNVAEGGQWINQKVDLTDIPVFVKEGSFIPMFLTTGDIHNTGDYDRKHLTVKYYPSSLKTSYTLFDDDGHTNNTLKSGDYELITFTGRTSLTRANGKMITIDITSTGKHLAGRTIKLMLPDGESILSVNNLPPVNSHEVEINFNGKPAHVSLKLK